MMSIHVENISDLAVIECKGRITRSDTVFKLRDTVMTQDDSSIITLDLSEVEAMSGGGLGMLAFLERWARENNIRLKLYRPSKPVLEGLVQNRSLLNFEIISFHEMMSILAHSDSRYAIAA
jgi:anti-anti-sigma regulatory factor